MNKENLRARQPGIAAIKAAGFVYRPQTNYVAMARRFGVSDSPQESGIPDGLVHLPGSRICYVEFKHGQGVLDLSIWRENQRDWWKAYCVPTDTLYKIMVWVSYERHITRANHDRAFFFCVPAAVWIETEQAIQSAYGVTTIPAVDAYRARCRETLDKLWDQFKLLRQDGRWVLPPELMER